MDSDPLIFLLGHERPRAWYSSNVDNPFPYPCVPPPPRVLDSTALSLLPVHFRTQAVQPPSVQIRSLPQSQKNEVFLDVVERLSVLIASNVSLGSQVWN